MIAVKLPKLQVVAGQKLLIKDVSWQEFEEILEELGDHRASRIAYHQGDLEIRMPLPEHERSKIIIADFLEDFASEFPALFGFTFSLTFF